MGSGDFVMFFFFKGTKSKLLSLINKSCIYTLGISALTKKKVRKSVTLKLF